MYEYLAKKEARKLQVHQSVGQCHDMYRVANTGISLDFSSVFPDLRAQIVLESQSLRQAYSVLCNR